MKKQLLSMMTCMALLAAGCGDTNKPGENTGGGGTGNDNEDPVPDLRHIVRVDVTETDGEVTEQENYRFAYDLRNRLTEMTHEYAGKEETDGERITLDYTEWPTVRYAIQGYEQGYPFKDEMMARMDEEHHRLKELDWNRWVTQGNDEVQILVTSDYTYNEKIVWYPSPKGTTLRPPCASGTMATWSAYRQANWGPNTRPMAINISKTGGRRSERNLH